MVGVFVRRGAFFVARAFFGANEHGCEAHVVRGLEVAHTVLEEDRLAHRKVEMRDELVEAGLVRLGLEA